MRIFVTGGSGFVGSRLIPRLVGEGHSVFALARSASSDEAVRASGATPIRGDLGTGDELVLPAIDAVVHAAAMFRFAGPRAPYFRVNVTGTHDLLEAAERAGASTFVHFSSAAVIMDDRGSPVHGADEIAPTYPDSFSAYIASKARSEALVLAANNLGFAPLPSVHPPSGGQAIPSVARSPRRSAPAASRSSSAVIVRSRPAMWTT